MHPSRASRSHRHHLRAVQVVFSLVLALQALASAEPAFQELIFNPRWYRTFDTSSSIIPADGGLLYAWDFKDPDKAVDSFFVGIDTLWGLPQDQNGDTASDWDLQVCPDEICMNGLKAGIHGANSPYPFDSSHFQAEHHVQFFPAVDTAANFTWAAPARSLFGAMMFCPVEIHGGVGHGVRVRGLETEMGFNGPSAGAARGRIPAEALGLRHFRGHGPLSQGRLGRRPQGRAIPVATLQT